MPLDGRDTLGLSRRRWTWVDERSVREAPLGILTVFSRLSPFPPLPFGEGPGERSPSSKNPTPPRIDAALQRKRPPMNPPRSSEPDPGGARQRHCLMKIYDHRGGALETGLSGRRGGQHHTHPFGPRSELEVPGEVGELLDLGGHDRFLRHVLLGDRALRL